MISAAVDPALPLEQSSLGFVLWSRVSGAFLHDGAEQLVAFCRAPYGHWIRELYTDKADQSLFGNVQVVCVCFFLFFFFFINSINSSYIRAYYDFLKC